MKIGVNVVDVTPPAGLAMAGFAARTSVASGSHDSLTVRALVVGDTALVTVDAIGITAKFSKQVKDKLVLPASNVVIHATHTHGGTNTLQGQLHPEPDEAYLLSLEQACIKAVKLAVENAVPAKLSLIRGLDPDVARNRRREDGPIDRSLLMLIARNEKDQPIACLVNYACHPVVLGADNLLWTADYPHFVRQEIEAKYEGAKALFLTGCVGDLNTGHTAAASLSTTAQNGRDYPTAKKIGKKIAASLDQDEQNLDDQVRVQSAQVELCFTQRESKTLQELSSKWRGEIKTNLGNADLLRIWADWADRFATAPLTPLKSSVSLLEWGGLLLVAMPGEIFAQTALLIREKIKDDKLMLAGFCEDNPGYIPPTSEFQYGGYEVDEAHRYYGQPATFAPGTAEAIANCVISLADNK